MSITRVFLDTNQTELENSTESVGFKWTITFTYFRSTNALPFFENNLIGTGVILTTQRTVSPSPILMGQFKLTIGTETTGFI